MQFIQQVTGANKGIGYGIVKGLIQQFDGIIYLTARDASRGQEALEKLQKVRVFFNVVVHHHLACIYLFIYLFCNIHIYYTRLM